MSTILEFLHHRSLIPADWGSNSALRHGLLVSCPPRLCYIQGQYIKWASFCMSPFRSLFPGHNQVGGHWACSPFSILTEYSRTRFNTVSLCHGENLNTLPTCAGNSTQLKEFSNLTAQLPGLIFVLCLEMRAPFLIDACGKKRISVICTLFARVKPREFWLFSCPSGKSIFLQLTVSPSWLSFF